jgi:hypothetical protein
VLLANRRAGKTQLPFLQRGVGTGEAILRSTLRNRLCTGGESCVKTTPEIARRQQQFVELRNNGWSFADIARHFGVDPTYVRNTWASITSRNPVGKPEMWTRPCLRCRRTVTVERVNFLCDYCRRNCE